MESLAGRIAGLVEETREKDSEIEAEKQTLYDLHGRLTAKEAEVTSL
jgi:hypothetical protein